MEKIPVELIENILKNFKNDFKSYKEYCKSSKYINSICQNFSKREIKAMGYNTENNKLNYIDIFYLLNNTPFKLLNNNKDQILVSAFLDGCYNDNIDIIIFALNQDIMKKNSNFKSIITGQNSEELINKCIGVGRQRNYKAIVKYLLSI